MESHLSTGNTLLVHLEHLKNQYFQLPAHDLEEVLDVTVDDWDKLSGNDFIGKVRVAVETLSHRETVRAWYALETEDGQTVQGRIELACRYVYDPAYHGRVPTK